MIHDQEEISMWYFTGNIRFEVDHWSLDSRRLIKQDFAKSVTVQLNWNIKAKQDVIDYFESLKLIYRNIFSTVSSAMNFNNFVWSIAGQNRHFFSSRVTPNLPISYFPSNVRFDAFHEGRNKCYKHRFPSDSHTQIYTVQCWRRLRTLSCIQEKDVILIACPSPTGPYSASNTLTRRTINQISMKWVDLN